MELPKLQRRAVESGKAEKEEEEENGEIFGVILSRSRSATCSILALRAEKENTNSSLKRVFSLRRSSSVSTPTGYYKIFHHCDDLPFADAHNEVMHVAGKTRRRRRRRANIFEACRRLIHRVLA
ncbi:hypothetical protein CCACVL1_05208 [Corchorus capsularis]|uniref:Uncharacterized protein n=1 Tax=Corchorus capsularis TaxID=210143 RepID=A0A1R3JM04_COCAP|nr:hypothetical protein CCACVL1_05208 [Corchorus capsularis]